MTKLTAEDRSERIQWGFHKNAFKTFGKTMLDIYENIYQVVQNATGAVNDKYNDENTISITVPVPGEPNPEHLVIKVSDTGPWGITKDYDGQVQEFIDGALKKSFSNKSEHNFGIGMIQYPFIGSSVLIFSETPICLCRIPLYLDDEGIPSWGKYKLFAKDEKNRSELELHYPGTRVEIYDPLEQIVNIDELINMILDRFGLLIARNHRLNIIVNGTRLEPPKMLIERPERPLFTTESGIEVRGDIWQEKKGNGHTTIFAFGELAQQKLMYPRQFKCWLAIDSGDIKADLARKGLIYTKDREQVYLGLKNLSLRFDPIVSDEVDHTAEHKRFKEGVTSFLKKSMVDILPKISSAFGPDENKPKKIEATGDKHGVGIIGYPTPIKKYARKKKKKGKKKRKRDNTKQRQVGSVGTDSVTIQQERDTDNRRDYTTMSLEEKNLGGKNPLLHLPAGTGVTLMNLDSYRYALIRKQKKPQIRNTLLAGDVAKLKYKHFMETAPDEVALSLMTPAKTIMYMEEIERNIMIDNGLIDRNIWVE